MANQWRSLGVPQWSDHSGWVSTFRIRQQGHHPLHADKQVIVVKLAPNWVTIVLFFFLMVCLAVVSILAGRRSREVISSTVALFLGVSCLARYVFRRLGVGLGTEDDEKRGLESADRARGPSNLPEQPPILGRSRRYDSPQSTWNGTGPLFKDGAILTHLTGVRYQKLLYMDYTVGWICAIPIEMAAARAMLDEVHADLPARSFDDNTYILGSMCSHNIVITCLPAGKYGAVTAATVATRMLSTFQSIRFGLMVGIGGGVPSQADIRLGDVVVGMPTKDSKGVVQCDIDFERTSTLNTPPQVLLNALSKLQTNHFIDGNRIPILLSEMAEKYPLMKDRIAAQGTDHLFCAEYRHSGVRVSCSHCDTRHLITRVPRSTKSPQIHYGTIASASQVVRDGIIRDRLAQRLHNLCFEMEAAGLMDKFSLSCHPGYFGLRGLA